MGLPNREVNRVLHGGEHLENASYPARFDLAQSFREHPFDSFALYHGSMVHELTQLNCVDWSTALRTGLLGTAC